MRKFPLLISMIFMTFVLSAQDKTVQLFQNAQYPTGGEEIILKFTVLSKEQLNTYLTNILSIDNVRTLPNGQGFEVTAYATNQQFQEFLTRNIPYEIITPAQAKSYTMATTVAQMANWDRYPTYFVYEQMMANFAIMYPNLCEIDTILSPTPSGNYRILVAKISDNVHSSENKPQFLYTSSMHGDETTGYILMLRLINYLLTNYGSNSKVTNLVNNVEIWINPLANPEGTYYNSTPAGSIISNARRGNLSNVDLNRNYPDPRAGQHPDGNAWQAETQAFMNFANNHHFNMSCNFHGGAEVVNYPWDTWITTNNPNANRLWWERVCTAYVDTSRLITPTYFSSVTADGVTEGGDWYVITGGRQDYMNYFKHCREVTIELDATKKTPSENLNTKWNQNFRSILNYIQESTNGVHGVITNSCTGQPIRAKVWVNGYDQVNDSSQVYSALPTGNYYKYMIAGTYDITYSAPGFTSRTITGVVVNNGTATNQNIQLTPMGTPAARSLLLKVFQEGLYIGGGLMREALNDSFLPQWGNGIADTVSIELRGALGYDLATRFNNVQLHTDGNLQITIIDCAIDGYYYITIYPRNSIPITTATPQSFSGSSISYDFTFPAGQAYGYSSQKYLGGVYGMYTGELDHDAYYAIDGSDVTIIDPDIILGPYGYLVTDLNGDGVVDGSDMTIMDANAILGPIFWNPIMASEKHPLIYLNK